MKALFIGGPLHEEVRDVADGQQVIRAMDPAPTSVCWSSPDDASIPPEPEFRTVLYTRKRHRLLGTVFVLDGTNDYVVAHVTLRILRDLGLDTSQFFLDLCEQLDHMERGLFGS